jgi:hypothetical protein
MTDTQTPGQGTRASTTSPPRVEMPGAPALAPVVEVLVDSIAQTVVEVVGLGNLLDSRRKNAHNLTKHSVKSTPSLDKARGSAIAVPFTTAHGAAAVNILRWKTLSHTVCSLDLTNTLPSKIFMAQQELDCCLLSSSPTDPRQHIRARRLCTAPCKST